MKRVYNGRLGGSLLTVVHIWEAGRLSSHRCAHREACRKVYLRVHTGRHAREVYLRVHTQGGMLGRYTLRYTHREAYREVYPVHTPREAC